MQRNDGSWIKMDIPPIAELGMKTILESWDAYTKTKTVTWTAGQIIL